MVGSQTASRTEPDISRANKTGQLDVLTTAGAEAQILPKRFHLARLDDG